MSRLVTGLLSSALAIAVAGQAHGADWGTAPAPLFKPAYPADWEPESPLGFEVGLRYWYSMGEQDFSLNGSDYSGEDISHSVEAHLRIDDYSTSTYLKGEIGFGSATSNEVTTPNGSGTFDGGRLAYAGADFGYTPFSGDGFALGGFVGYQYLHDSPDMGRENYYNTDTISWVPGAPDYLIGGHSETNSINIHALRLGISAKAEFGDFIDVVADLAAIPYASVTGVLGAHGLQTTTAPGLTYYPTSPIELEGNLYGGAAQIMVGFHPTENLTLRIGARGYYLTGPVRTDFTIAAVTDPMDLEMVNPATGVSTAGQDGFYEVGPTVSEQGYVANFDNFEILRWGPMIELTGRF